MGKKQETEEFLKNLGISVSDKDFDNTEKEEAVKIDESLKGQLDSVLSILPEVVLHKNYEGTYRVIYDKGLGVLQEVKGKPNMHRGVVVKKGTNNSIVGGVELQKIGSAAQISANVFEVASIIVGQYYMFQINDKLRKMNSNILSIERFLSNDKKAGLVSINKFLSDVENNILAVTESDRYWSSTLTTIQNKRIDAYDSIKFYEMQIDGLKEELNKKDKVDDANKNIKEMQYMIAEYWMSVYLYCKAYSLEVYLSGNTSNQYYENAIRDMSDVCISYQERNRKWKKDFTEYYLSLSKLEKNKILDYSRKMKDIVPIDAPSIMAFVMGSVLDIVYEIDENNKERTKKEAYSKINNEQFESIKEMEVYINRVIDIMSLYNGRVEIVKNDEGIFIKKDNKLKEEVLS